MSYKKLATTALLLGIAVLAALAIYRRTHRPPPGEWLRELNKGMDEMFKSNGLEQVGKHAWTLPRDRESIKTNGPTPPKPEPKESDPKSSEKEKNGAALFGSPSPI